MGRSGLSTAHPDPSSSTFHVWSHPPCFHVSMFPSWSLLYCLQSTHVREVLSWNTKKGELFKAALTHLRIQWTNHTSHPEGATKCQSETETTSKATSFQGNFFPLIGILFTTTPSSDLISFWRLFRRFWRNVKLNCSSSDPTKRKKEES